MLEVVGHGLVGEGLCAEGGAEAAVAFRREFGRGNEAFGVFDSVY